MAEGAAFVSIRDVPAEDQLPAHTFYPDVQAFERWLIRRNVRLPELSPVGGRG